MKANQYPVILVHGWNSHPGIWKNLVVHLKSAGIPYGNFDHSGMRDSTLPEISAALLDYLGTDTERTQMVRTRQYCKSLYGDLYCPVPS